MRHVKVDRNNSRRRRRCRRFTRSLPQRHVDVLARLLVDPGLPAGDLRREVGLLVRHLRFRRHRR